jgi:alkane 1-monooxygenase
MGSTIAESVPTNGKYRHIAACFLPQVPFVLLAVGAYYRGYWLLLPALFLLIVIPLLDTLTGWQDNVQFQKTDFSSAETFFLHWNTRLYAIFYITALLWVLKSLNHLSRAEVAFALASLSLLGGVGFAAAHELLHRSVKFDQLLQRIMTSFLFYPHYKLIHVQSHHHHAATDHDKNTAWFDEGVYAYFLRTIPESMIRCWQMEDAHISKPASIWARIFKNRMVGYAIGQVALLALLYRFASWQGLLFYFGQVVGAHLVLESVNYIQHYGLMRKEQDGQYERTAAEHSWDTYHYFSSYVTFRVGHHSFHHISMKPYYLLAPEEKAPKLPVGYFWAIPMVLIPPWWRRVINPKLSAAENLVSQPS